MGDIDLAVKSCKRLEGLLERDFHARGKGLHEKVSSVESHLPPALVKRLRYIATVRNKLVHEADVTHIDDRRGFKQACTMAEQQLESLAGRGGNPIVLVLAVLVGFALLYGAAVVFIKLKVH